MNGTLTFLGFWAINDTLDTNALKRQLDDFHELGFDGVIWHPRNYPGTPEYLGERYFEILSDVIVHAKRLGLEFWIYDEDGWPSGSASGKVRAVHPDLAMSWLEYHDGNVVERSAPALLNTFNTATCRDFIRLTYDGYAQGLRPEAFDHIAGFFSDEVGFLEGHGATYFHHGVPWCDDLAERYRARYGEELDRELLFAEREGSRRTRANYWELATDLLNENFYTPINDWCTAHGKAYTAHTKGEESPYFQVPYSGSVYQVMRHVNVPAIDALERDPGNHYYPHIAGSIARQFHSGRTLCEAMGGAGWGVNPESWRRYIEWLVECGVDTFALHLSQLSLNAQAIRDWPASQPFGLTWREAFPVLLANVRAFAARRATLERGRERVLVVCPTRGVMERFDPAEMPMINEHDGDGVPDSAAGRISNRFNALIEQLHDAGELYDVTEERVLEEAGEVMSDGGVRVGRCIYHRLMLAEGCSFRDDTLRARLEQVAEPQDRWRIVRAGVNQLPLDLVAGSADERMPHMLHAAFTVRDARRFGVGTCELAFSDIVTEVRLNDVPLQAMSGASIADDARPAAAIIYEVPLSLLHDGANTVTVQATDAEPAPFAWLRGDFRVLSASAYAKVRDPRQSYTAGPLMVMPSSGDFDCANLTQSGMPFRFAPVTMTRRLRLARPASNLRFTQVHADAIRVQVDGECVGWAFGPDYAVSLDDPLPAGDHEIAIDLYPSTYNTYGPHHHLDGDRHVISPVQYQGVKNFADWADSPDRPVSPGWHVVTFGIGDRIVTA